MKGGGSASPPKRCTGAVWPLPSRAAFLQRSHLEDLRRSGRKRFDGATPLPGVGASDSDGDGTKIARSRVETTGRLRWKRPDGRTGIRNAGPSDREEVVMKRDESQNIGCEGFCICIECSTRVPRRSWVTCIERNCPNCGAVMVREGSPYHLFLMEQDVAYGGRPGTPSRRPGKENRKGRMDIVLGHSC
jgi:hypothetical protein